MSSEGLPVDGVVGTDIVLGTRSTQQATDEAKSSLSADSAAQSADAAFKFSKKSEQYSNESSAFAEKSAASAAAAKISENNAAVTLASAVKNGQYGQVVPPRIQGPIGARRYCKIATSVLTATGSVGMHFAIVGGRNYGTLGLDVKYVYFTGRGATTTALHARGLEILSLGVTPGGGDIEVGTLYNATTGLWELWVSGPAFNVPSITLIGNVDGQVMGGVVPMADYKWQEAPDGYKAYAIKNTYSDYNALENVNVDPV